MNRIKTTEAIIEPVERISLVLNEINLLETKSYQYHVTEQQCRLLHLKYNGSLQGTALGVGGSQIYFYEMIDSQRYGPVVHLAKPLCLSGLASISYSLCPEQCNCSNCFRRRFPYRVYAPTWFLFDQVVPESEFREYIKKQEFEFRTLLEKNLIADILTIIAHYLTIPQYPNELPEKYQRDYPVDLIYDEVNKASLMNVLYIWV